MKRAALYARVSSDTQQKEATIESQIAELETADRRNHTLTERFGQCMVCTLQ